MKETKPMKTMTTEMTVCDYRSGQPIGDIDIDKSQYRRIVRQAQQPEEIWSASSLSADQRNELGVESEQTLYFSGSWG